MGVGKGLMVRWEGFCGWGWFCGGWDEFSV